jgi:hypothetical protein
MSRSTFWSTKPVWKIDAGVTAGFEFGWPFNAICIKAKKEWSFASAPYTFIA